MEKQFSTGVPMDWTDYNCPDCGETTQHLASDNRTPSCAKCDLERAQVTMANVRGHDCKECQLPSITLLDGICNTCLSKKDENDSIHWPKHYNTGKIQPIDAIEDWKLDFRLANAVKYIARHEHKEGAKRDLEKAIWYIQRYISKELTKESNNG